MGRVKGVDKYVRKTFSTFKKYFEKLLQFLARRTDNELFIRGARIEDETVKTFERRFHSAKG